MLNRLKACKQRKELINRHFVENQMWQTKKKKIIVITCCNETDTQKLIKTTKKTKGNVCNKKRWHSGICEI